MTVRFLAAAALLSSTAIAHAGGIDRSGQGISALFEQGRYGEFSLGSISPSTSGSSVAGLGNRPSGDLTPSYFQFSAAYKADINDRLSYAIIYDQPFGADVAYPAGTGYFAAGTTAEFESHALTGILRYKLENNVSFHGGLRVQSVSATANIPFVGGYSVVGDSDVSLGYLVGVAYERPDIALRVSLTYNSKIKHDVSTSERFGVGPVSNTITQIETPQSVNLEFQTGIAADTLLFGGLRWTDYSSFDITPAGYQGATGGSLLSYQDDVYTWSLGVGRRLNDTWAVSASVDYEKANGGFAANLGPTDGKKSLALAAVYTRDNMKITTGIRYVNIGDAQTAIPGNAPASNFTDNDAIAIGVKVGFSF
ncbi:MAG: outer membrane protein transport protein [Sulfitobacter sp.]